MKKITLCTLMCAIACQAFSQTESLFIRSWVTKSDRTDLLAEQSTNLYFSDQKLRRGYPIVVDDQQEFQSMDGFGFSLTGGSAELLSKMSGKARSKIIRELFSRDEGIGISYIRLTIGASDLNSFVFSYDDMAIGETDSLLSNFTLAQDLIDVIPVMKEVLAINPTIRIMASPWSAPAWMKTNENVRGGALDERWYEIYAKYLIRYIEDMKTQGIDVGAITLQNEPLNSRNTPSMQWWYLEQAKFIKDHLGPQLRQKGLDTEIMLFDHNTDRIDYPLALMSDPEVDQYVIGSAFHNYGGDMSAMTLLHLARPDRNLYFTEQMVTEREPDGSLNIAGSVRRLLIGSTRNWSKNVILWNLAADPNNDPHTDNGGCPFCQGAITIDGDKVTRNLAYYTIAHASKFVPEGSVRVMSTFPGDTSVRLTEDEENPKTKRAAVITDVQLLPNVAFKTPDQKLVLVVANDTFSTRNFSIQYKGKYVSIELVPGAVSTYVWQMF